MTGGAGYIGSAVTSDLIKKGHRVTVLDNLSTGFRKLIPSKASFYKTDISNITNLKKIFKIVPQNFGSFSQFNTICGRRNILNHILFLICEL